MSGVIRLRFSDLAIQCDINALQPVRRIWKAGMFLEVRGQRVWLNYAKRFAEETFSDSYGNCVAVLNKGGSPRLMLALAEAPKISARIARIGATYHAQTPTSESIPRTMLAMAMPELSGAPAP